MAQVEDPIRAAQDALARYVIGGAPLDETLSHVAEVAVTADPGARFAGISTLVDGDRARPCSVASPSSRPRGIVMSGSRCGPDEAFQVLVRASHRENRGLREIAAAIVERTEQRG